ncbi:MAG: protein-disulfide reductase DsbD domain-containing protein [Pseudomonadota bacterium]
MKHLLALAIGAACALPLSTAAQSIVSRGQSFVSVGIIPGALDASGTRTIGLSLEMEKEWKTYWRSPGQAGIPPSIDWSASQNLAEAEIRWPMPAVYESFGLKTVGYADRVTLPVVLTPKDPAKPIQVSVSLMLGVCRDICVLEETSITGTLPADLVEGADYVEMALKSVPPPGAELGMQSATCRIAGSGKSREFRATLAFDRPVGDAVVLIEGPDGAWFHQTKTRVEAEQVHVTSDLDLLFDDVWMTRDAVRMTLLAGDWAADVQGCEAP